MTAQLTTDVAQAAAILRSGGLVAFATETVYGLGANALVELAVARVFAAKQRPTFDPLIVHLADANDLATVACDVPEPAQRLIEAFWPGPLTLVLPKQPVVPDLVTAGLGTVAVRVPAHPMARELIRLSGVPIAAPSANPFGRISPTTAQHVLDFLSEEIDMVLDGGACVVGVESTVLECSADGSVRLLRPGGLTIEEIEACIGPLAARGPTILDQHSPQVSPGLLAQHYAPRTRLLIVEDWAAAPYGENTGVLAFTAIASPENYGAVEILAPDGSLETATARFFAALRRLDEADVELIIAQRFPDHGLGRALNDRLIRAAGKWSEG
ncbi:L-threonylcarbamoyladenylate synthase [Planctomicrobium piriforme]|uniref:Threonylcarbamoyl-AMP synthase n=1 Tax=Planctomicrobium piriforme TaxID=1576369 RepID=A0A1I3B3X6_9PLAN|nr:L-threonylcarbamoyladenylate synthase [Planctomicrobium piriforme]SFH56649.1 L-threonylcarbamoyladenylate synthase [Planctomicrobium piriforme]